MEVLNTSFIIKKKKIKTPFIDWNSFQMRTKAAMFADSLILLHLFL